VIRVALLDDHPAVIVGLQRLLAPATDIEVLAAAANEAVLARELRGRRPDVLIVDYDPRRRDALALCRRVKGRPDPIRVLIYSAYAGPALTVAARAAQADGLVDKAESAASLTDAIRRVAAGETVMPKVSRAEFEGALARLEQPDLPVFAMLLDGAPVSMIAEGLRTDEREAARRAQRVVARLRPRLTPVRARSGHAGSRSG